MRNLRIIREDRDLLQKDAAYALGISRAAYSNYEAGLRSPDPDMLKKMADLYAVSIDELLDYRPKNQAADILRTEERLLLKKYRSLSQKGRERTLKQLDFELKMEAACKYEIKQQNPRVAESKAEEKSKQQENNTCS